MVYTVQFVITAANVGAECESAKFWEEKMKKYNWNADDADDTD